MTEMQLDFNGGEITLADLNHLPGKRPCPICGRLVSDRGGRHRLWHEQGGLRWATEDEQQEILRLYRQRDATIRSVTAQVAFSATTVRNVLHDHGVLRTRADYGRRAPVDTLLETAQLYGRLGSMARVAEVMGVNRHTVRRRLEAMDVPILGKGRPGKRIPAQECRAAAGLYASGLTMDEVAKELGLYGHHAVARRLRMIGARRRTRWETLHMRAKRQETP